MGIANIIAAAGTIAAIVAPTIPGCGMLSSMFLKIGVILSVTEAAEIAERAVAGESIRTPLFSFVVDATLVAVCIWAVVAGFVPGWVAALICVVCTSTMQASVRTNGALI